MCTPASASQHCKRYSQLRERYRPRRIRVLFVAESPPESKGNEFRFFYNPKQERRDYLFRSVMQAVFPDFEYRPGQKEKSLRRFQEAGYYLIDATDHPVNLRSDAERRRELDGAVEAKLTEIEMLVSPSTPIILVKKNVFKLFSPPLRRAGYNVVHNEFLPFPSHSHQNQFVEGCRGCLPRRQTK